MRHPAPKLSYFTIEELHANLIRQCNSAGLPFCFRELIDFSFSEKYNWKYNGVTLMKDEQHPVLYAWIHDFMWITGAGGYKSDLILRYVRDKQGYNAKVSNMYFLGVHLGWLLGFKWWHKLRKNVRELTPIEQCCFQIAKKFYL